MCQDKANRDQSWMERVLGARGRHGSPRCTFDPEQLSLVCRGDGELERFVLGRFLTEAPAYLASMRGAVDSGDWDDLLSRSHAFRDAAQVVGAYDLARACLRFELSHDRLDSDLAAALVDEVDHCYQEVALEVARFLRDRVA